MPCTAARPGFLALCALAPVRFANARLRSGKKTAFLHEPNRLTALRESSVEGLVAERLKKAKYESPKARLARVKAEAKQEALVNRQRVPLDDASFGGFLRHGLL